MKNVYVIDKPKNWTSNDVLRKIKFALKIKKIGHGGTLDPLATGVLVIGINDGTKFLNEQLNSTKKYLCKIQFGFSTTTFDLEGEIVNHATKIDINKEQIIDAINSFCNHYLQTPPIYSAVKKDGKPLYKYARNNIQVNIEPKEVKILNYDFISYNENILTIEIEVSKGFYVRSFANDLGIALGNFATLIDLRRTKSGQFSIDLALSIDDFITKYKENDLL